MSNTIYYMHSTSLQKKLGISRDTLRHYVALGLLLPQRNLRNGYLEYSSEDEKALEFILQAKKLGFTLQNIKELRDKVRDAHCPHQSILPNLEKNLSLVQEKILDLRELRRSLEKIIKNFSKKDCSRKRTPLSMKS